MITPKQVEEIGLYQNSKQKHLFSDMEDIVFNLKTRELFYHSCVDGELTLAMDRIKTVDDLKQALYDCFPHNRNELNLDY